MRALSPRHGSRCITSPQTCVSFVMSLVVDSCSRSWSTMPKDTTGSLRVSHGCSGRSVGRRRSRLHPQHPRVKVMERWKSEWQSIESRIAGLQSTASLVLAASGIHTNGLAYEALSNFALRPTLPDVLGALVAFGDAYVSVLPERSSEYLKKGIERIFEVIGRERSRWQQASWQAAFNATAVLVGLRAEVASSLVDNDALGRRITERAFEHLQRSIVADEGCRSRWEAAYQAGR